MESRIHREVYVRFGGEEVGNLRSQGGKALISLAYYMSELLGKETIDKKSSGETKGKQGSSSRNYDVLGRELLTPDETRKLNNKKCLVLIRGFDPIYDNKYVPFGHPAFGQTADGKGAAYVHVPMSSGNVIGPVLELLSPEAVAYYEKLQRKGEGVYIDSLSYEEFSLLTGNELQQRFLSLDEQQQRELLQNEEEPELEYTPELNDETNEPVNKAERPPGRNKLVGEDTLVDRMLQWDYTPEQKAELDRMMECRMPTEDILYIFYPGTSVEQLRGARQAFISLKASGAM